MKEDSEAARLMGNKSQSNVMSYTDGPKALLANSAATAAPTAPPAYEKTVITGEEPWRKDSTGCRSEQSQDSEILSELMNYNGSTLMTQFHADALKQVGYGKYQMLMIFVAGLALAAQTIQVFSLFFVLPSADLEFCMESHEKRMLVIINLIGSGLGAMNAGAIAELNGRKRTLLSCLFCMALFSVVSAFMPTYGPFVMARFCASACAGGIFPIGATYICEMTSGGMRGRSVAVFTSIGLIGGTVAAAASILMLPMSGEELMLEHREHFSAWHRYLLVMALSAIMPIFGLLMLPESPRWLLDVGREVEALEIYQRIYCANRSSGRYTLTELELPGIRTERHQTPKSVLGMMANNAHQFFDSFVGLIRPPYTKTTSILMVIWFGSMIICYGLTIYVLKFGRSVEAHLFSDRTVTILNNTYDNTSFTINMVNQHFASCHFYNCTFEQIFLSYVQFKNCTFQDSNFHGVKTGNTSFINTYLSNVKFIDTDLADQNFVNTTQNNTEFDRMIDGCDQQFDFNTFNQVEYHANLACILPSIIILIWCGEFSKGYGRVRLATLSFALAAVLCCTVGFLCIGEPIYWIVGIVQALTFSGLISLTIYATEVYPTHLRCTALGVFICCGYIGALFGARCFARFPVGDTHITAVVAITGLLFPSIFSTFLKETSQLL